MAKAPCFTPSDLNSYPWTQDELNYVWQYAKDNYIDKGTLPSDAIWNTANDLGLKGTWVLEAFAKPKAMRHITSQMYLEMSRRRRAADFARQTVYSFNLTPAQRIARRIWNTPFGIKVFGHGTVGMQTHAGARLFNPTTWFVRNADGTLGGYFPEFWNQFKYTFDPALHEKEMDNLVRSQNFALGKRAGLANDPTVTYTDYGHFAQYLPRAIGEMGKRGFDTLKKFRQDWFNYEWEKVPATAKADPKTELEYARNIAEMVNHGTGVIKAGERGYVVSPFQATLSQELLFAARLEGSRWARILSDTPKTINTYLKGSRATAAEKHIANMRTRNAIEFLRTYALSLVINDAIQASVGSKNRINWTDPSRNDWLAHKMGDHTLYLEGRLLAPVRFLAHLAQTLTRPKGYELRDQPAERVYKATGRYIRGKLGPPAEVAAELLTGRGFTGEPLPWSSEKPSLAHPRMTGGEYAATFAPIPGEGFFKEYSNVMNERGVHHSQAEAILKGIMDFGVSLTGAGYQPTPPQTPAMQRRPSPVRRY